MPSRPIHHRRPGAIGPDVQTAWYSGSEAVLYTLWVAMRGRSAGGLGRQPLSPTIKLGRRMDDGSWPVSYAARYKLRRSILLGVSVSNRTSCSLSKKPS
jgi:hypothetical protein